MFVGGCEDINEIFNHVMKEMLMGSSDAVDLVKSPTIYSYNNLLMSDSCSFELDLASIGLTKNRWARFLTQYIAKDELKAWLKSINEQRRGVVNLLRSLGDTKVVPSLYNPEEEGHRWGACFLGVSFQLMPQPRLVLYSRTARMPTTATMELTLIYHLAREIKERYHLSDEIRFTWFCTAIHITAFDIMPYLIYRGEMKQFLESGVPFTKFVKRQYQKALDLPATREAIPYGRQRRITRRVKELEAGKPLPSHLISQLSLWDGHR